MRYFKVAVALIGLIVAGFVVRYGSASPCDWLVHDWSANTGVPTLVVEGLVRAQLRMASPTAGRCLKGWVQLHFKGIEEIG